MFGNDGLTRGCIFIPKEFPEVHPTPYIHQSSEHFIRFLCISTDGGEIEGTADKYSRFDFFVQQDGNVHFLCKAVIGLRRYVLRRYLRSGRVSAENNFVFVDDGVFFEQFGQI